MPATMDDVNEMRLEAADMAGLMTRHAEHLDAEGNTWGRPFIHDCIYAGSVGQYAIDLEAWVTLRTRIEALRMVANENRRANMNVQQQVLFAGDVAAFDRVLKIMDELEES